MPGLKNRFRDNQRRFESTNWKIEVGQVEETHYHNYPNDPDFCSVTVLIRDKRMVRDGKNYTRLRIPVWQRFVGNCFGAPWQPRKGDMVYIAFFKNEKAFVVASAYNWQSRPFCIPGSDLDIVNKICQWQPPTKRNATNEFTEIPPGKKPVCSKWFHGPVPESGCPTIGRDLIQFVHECKEGHNNPDCRFCTDIDCVGRTGNTWRKVYSSQTESCESPPSRMEDHVLCGSYHRFESENGHSEEYSEGVGHIREGNAVSETDKRGHFNFKGNIAGGAGTLDMHAAHEEVPFADEHIGARIAAVHNLDTSVDFACEMIYFDKGAFVWIMKDGQIIISTPYKITMESTAADVLIKAATKITLDAPLVEETQDNKIDGDNTILGSCDHQACSCEGGSEGWI